MSDFYYITSNRGYKILVLNGYKFHKKAVFFKGTKIKWCCATRLCPALVYTDIEGAAVESLRGTHTHEPVPTNELICRNISNTLKQVNEIGKKKTSVLLKEHLRMSDININLSVREKDNIRKNIWRQIKKSQQKRLGTEDCSPKESADGKSEQEGTTRTKNNDKGSGESLDSFPEDDPSCGMDEGDQYYHPETAFVPVDVIKEEPEEITEESDYLNIYSEDESLNELSNALNIRASDLMPETVLKTSPPVCEDPSLSDDRTLAYPPDDGMTTRGDTCVNENLASEMGKVVSGTDYDFTSLKNVVSKLEQISDKLAFAAVADQYEQFGKYLATLLRGIPQKKFLSLKQKFISDVIQAKMALDELNSPSPVTGASTVARPTNQDVVDLNNRQRALHQSSSTGRSYSNSDAVALPKQLSVPVRTSARDPGVPEASPVVPTPTTSTTFTPVLLRGNGINRSPSSTSNSNLKRPAQSTVLKKRVKKTQTEHVQEHDMSPKHTSPVQETAPLRPLLMEGDPLRCTEDRFEIEIEEGSELQDIKPDLFDTSTTSDCRTKQTGATLTPQQPVGALGACEWAVLAPAAAADDSAATTLLTCDICNLNFGSSIDRKRHFMVSHPGEIPSFKKTLPAESQNSSSKTQSQTLLSTSATPLEHQINPGDLGSKQKQLNESQVTEWPYTLPCSPE